jgi:hypothetical protein
MCFSNFSPLFCNDLHCFLSNAVPDCRPQPRAVRADQRIGAAIDSRRHCRGGALLIHSILFVAKGIDSYLYCSRLRY